VRVLDAVGTCADSLNQLAADFDNQRARATPSLNQGHRCTMTSPALVVGAASARSHSSSLVLRSMAAAGRSGGRGPDLASSS
jgi:hypothetical protein